MRRLAALLCFPAAAVTAQEPSVPAELLALRARTAAALAAASVPLAQQSADDFRRLEETRATRGDYGDEDNWDDDRQDVVDLYQYFKEDK
jgi:hypothetical protein